MTFPIPRDLLRKYFGADPRMLRAMDDISQNAVASVDNIASTSAMNDASVVTLSPNDAFNNEYVLTAGYGIIVEVTAPGQVTVRIDPSLIVTTNAPVFNYKSLGNYANDSAAAAAGVPKGGAYLNGSVFQVRVA